MNNIYIPFFEAVITIIILFISYVLYQYIVKPYKIYRFYKKILTENYKTIVYPFSLASAVIQQGKKNLKTHGDSQYLQKRIYPDYQVSLHTVKGITYVDLLDPQLIKQFYDKMKEQYYVKSMNFPMISNMKQFISDGLVFAQGAAWKSKKKIMSTFFNHQFIKNQIFTISKICQQKILEVESQKQNLSQNDIKMDVTNLFQRIYGNIVIKCFFGDFQLDKIEGQQIFSYINKIFQMNTQRSFSLYSIIFGRSLERFYLRKIDRQLIKRGSIFKQYAKDVVIEQIKRFDNAKNNKASSNKYRGLIEMLILENKLKENSFQTKPNEGKDFYTVQDLINQFTTFFMAGTDTTSNTSTIIVYNLSNYPQVQQKVRQEIQRVFPGQLMTESITYQKLKEMNYLQNVIKQTLRMDSPSAGLFPREATKDHYIGKIPIRKGIFVSLKIKSNHFRQSNHKNPFQFNPERWDSQEAIKNNPYSYFPFSSGTRNCIGSHLAMLQMKIAIIFILKRYKTIKLQKPKYKKYMRSLYGAEYQITTFEKNII